MGQACSNKTLVVGYETTESNLNCIGLGEVCTATSDRCTFNSFEEESQELTLNWNNIFEINGITTKNKEKKYYALRITKNKTSTVYYPCKIIQKGNITATVKYENDGNGNKRIPVSTQYNDISIPTIIEKVIISQQNKSEIMDILNPPDDDIVTVDVDHDNDDDDADDDDVIIDVNERIMSHLIQAGNVPPDSPNHNEIEDEKADELSKETETIHHETRHDMVRRIIAERKYGVQELKRILQYNGQRRTGRRDGIIDRIINNPQIDINVLTINQPNHQQRAQSNNDGDDNDNENENDMTEDTTPNNMTEPQKREKREELINAFDALYQEISSLEIDEETKETITSLITEIKQMYQPLSRRPRGKYAGLKEYIPDRKERINQFEELKEILEQRCHQLSVQTRALLILAHGNSDLLQIQPRLWCSAMVRNISVPLCIQAANKWNQLNEDFINNKDNLMNKFDMNEIIRKVEKIINVAKETGDTDIVNKAKELNLMDLGLIISDCTERQIDLSSSAIENQLNENVAMDVDADSNT